MMLRRGLAVALVSVVVLAGCGAAEKLSPRVAVREAAKATANQEEGSFTLSLVGSDADLNALFNGGAPLSDEDRQGLEIVRNSSLTLSTGADRFSLDVKAGDLDHAFELRYVDQKLYARADIAGLAELFGGSAEQVGQTLQGLASQPGFEFLAAAAAGRWVVADLSAMSGLFDGLAKQFGGGGSPIPGPTTDPAEVQGQFEALKDAIGGALSDDVSIKELESDSVGDHYVATVSSLRTFYAKVRSVLEQQMGSLPFGSDGLPPADMVPDQPASLDVWVKSGRVARLELDIAQFMPAPPAGAGRVAIRLDIAREAAAVTAPSDAVGVDLAGLVQQFLAQFGGFLEGLDEYD